MSREGRKPGVLTIIEQAHRSRMMRFASSAHPILARTMHGNFARSSLLLDILHLFTHLFDQHFEFDADGCHLLIG